MILATVCVFGWHAAWPSVEAAQTAGRQQAAASKNQVDLTFEGAFSARLSGAAGRCSLRQSGPIRGATWQVGSAELNVSPDFRLTIIAEPGGFDDPSITVNVTGAERASYGRRRGRPEPGITLAEDATSATIDVSLRVLGGTQTLRVTGTIRCAAPLVSK
jgi:hypothetical protein